jgi:apolipoprotein D and lipocalin family protein
MSELTAQSHLLGDKIRLISAAVVLGLLASCGSSPDVQRLRPPDDPIYSNASFDLSRLNGNWQQAASFAAQPGCTGGVAKFSADASGQITGEASLCVAGRLQGWSGTVTRVGPGRFTIGAGEPWWVLWDDADNRTLVIGTPSGAFGFVLDRTGDLPADRLAAAREILDFNGYDLAGLQTE